MKLNKYIFSCPYCDQILNNKEEIELKTLRDNGEVGTIYLAVNFGNYTYRHTPKVNFNQNEIVDFICPKCNTDLKSNQHTNFALLNMAVGNEINFEVIFSRQSGKRKTYVITEDGIETYQG